MSNLLNRRKFLYTGAVASAASFLPSSLRAKSAEAAASDIGKSKWDLDSPALCVDLDKMDQNIKKVHSRLKDTPVKVRPHIKTHKCPGIAKMQIAAGAVGVCAAKLIKVLS